MKRKEAIREYRSNAGRAHIEQHDGYVTVVVDEYNYRGGLHIWHSPSFENAIRVLYADYGCAWERTRVTHIGW